LLSKSRTLLVAILRLQYHREFSAGFAPSRNTSYWVIKKRENTGGVCDKRAMGRLTSSVNR
jgi:hypothetical protein